MTGGKKISNFEKNGIVPLILQLPSFSASHLVIHSIIQGENDHVWGISWLHNCPAVQLSQVTLHQVSSAHS